MSNGGYSTLNVTLHLRLCIDASIAAFIGTIAN